MSNGKDHRFRPPLYNAGSADDKSAAAAPPRSAAAPNEQQGWEAYRKWLSRVSMQPTRRGTKDASLYSWRGYNNWADKIRQNWKADES